MSKQVRLILALVALALAVAVSPVEAGRRWCEKDPVFLIAGTQVNVITAVPEEYVAAVTGPVAVTLYHPLGVDVELLAVDDGYNGYGEVVSIVPTAELQAAKRGVQILVEVTIPVGAGDVPVRVTAMSADGRSVSAKGTGNAVVALGLNVSPSA